MDEDWHGLGGERAVFPARTELQSETEGMVSEPVGQGCGVKAGRNGEGERSGRFTWPQLGESSLLPNAVQARCLLGGPMCVLGCYST